MKQWEHANVCWEAIRSHLSNTKTKSLDEYTNYLSSNIFSNVINNDKKNDANEISITTMDALMNEIEMETNSNLDAKSMSFFLMGIYIADVHIAYTVRYK